MIIREERPGDESAIRTLIATAFRSQPHSDGSESAIVDALRRDGDLSLSLVAEAGESIAGHIAFSPVTISNGAIGWYGLGPVGVAPASQRQGIGAGLIRRGLAILEGRGAGGAVLLGDPAYYERFGFKHDPALVYPGPPVAHFQRLVLAGDPPTGFVTYAPAFG